MMSRRYTHLQLVGGLRVPKERVSLPNQFKFWVGYIDTSKTKLLLMNILGCGGFYTPKLYLP